MYIVGRIRAAGGVAAEVFTRQAVALMHERSNGLPRTISVIADNALLGGYAAGQRPIGAELVAEICRDFDLNGTGTGPSGSTGASGAPGSGGSVSRGGVSAPQPPRLINFDQQHAKAVEPEKPTELFGAFATKKRRFSFFWS